MNVETRVERAVDMRYGEQVFEVTVPLDGLDAYQVSPGLTGAILRPLLEGRGDIRMHVSNGALASFAGIASIDR